MRFMVIITSNGESGGPSDSEGIAAMSRFNEEAIDAGILLAMEGLKSRDMGARITFEAPGRTVVTDGPFAEAKEVVAGFWMIQVDSLADALSWARRAPMGAGAELELREVQEVSDFESNEITAEHLRREQEFRDATIRPITR